MEAKSAKPTDAKGKGAGDEGLDGKDSQKGSGGEDLDGGVELVDEFEVSAQSKPAPLDIVWGIDNSGSMVEEAAQVRTNLERFADTLKARTDVRVGLISEAVQNLQGTHVPLPATLPAVAGHKQLPVSVGSTSALAYLAAATCPKELTTAKGSTTNGDAGTICGVPVATLGTDLGTELTDNTAGNPWYTIFQRVGLALVYPEVTVVTNIAGSLAQDFFRPDARRVYVVVTDDNATGIDADNFLKAIPNSDKVKPVVYSFRGVANRPADPATNTPACNVARRGVAYEKLTAATGGAVFDICDPDWSKNFAQLASSIVASLGLNFPLQVGNVIRVIEVTVDGKPLASDKYTIRDGRVEIDPKEVKSAGQKIKVRYVGKK